MKNKKRLLTIGLLVAISTTTLTGCAGGNWNPANWNWDWLNPTTWKIFQGNKDADPESTSTVSETEQEPASKARKIEMEINNAFGETGAKTITLALTPANANTGTITWETNNPAVVINPSADKKSATVYVTTYFKDYATISVHESFSDITATGKVFSYGAFDIPTTTGADYTHILDATNSQLAITSTSSFAQATVQEKVAIKHDKLKGNNALLSYYDLEQIKTTERSKAHSGYTYPSTKVWLHFAFIGSYLPVVLNQTTGTLYNATNYITHNKLTGGTANDIGNVVSIEITLAVGDNMILIAGRKHTIAPTAITVADFNLGVLSAGGKLVGAKSHTYSDFATPLIITNANKPQSMTIGDTTFYE